MLLKSADSKESLVADLKRKMGAAKGDWRAKLERNLWNVQAGIKAEQDVAYLIGFDYEKSNNWAIIHDLRLEVGGRTAQIDHLLINRFLDVYVLETKSFHSGLKINEEGEFLRWNDYAKKYEGMASPLAQNERHIAVLKEAFKEIKLPTKLGVALTPTFQSFVLVSSNARVDRPKNFDASKVIKADALKATIDKQIDTMGVLGAFGNLAKLIDEGALYAIGRRLAGLHKPLHASQEEDEARVLVGRPEAKDTVRESSPPSSVEQRQDNLPHPGRSSLGGTGPLDQAASADPTLPPRCKGCGKDTGSILHGQYGYYFKCSACSVNTSMKWDCGTRGHSPRIRKDGQKYYRECQGCGVSNVFHQNPEA